MVRSSLSVVKSMVKEQAKELLENGSGLGLRAKLGWQPASSPVPAWEPTPEQTPAAPSPAVVSPFAEAEPAAAAPKSASAPAEDQGEASPASGPTLEAVEELLEDLVRPALHADGGDIELVKVEGGDIYVRLLGACSSCPSSTITMRNGIERLMIEELSGFERLIQVEM